MVSKNIDEGGPMSISGNSSVTGQHADQSISSASKKVFTKKVARHKFQRSRAVHLYLKQGNMNQFKEKHELRRFRGLTLFSPKVNHEASTSKLSRSRTVLDNSTPQGAG